MKTFCGGYCKIKRDMDKPLCFHQCVSRDVFYIVHSFDIIGEWLVLNEKSEIFKFKKNYFKIPSYIFKQIEQADLEDFTDLTTFVFKDNSDFILWKDTNSFIDFTFKYYNILFVR